MRTARRRRRDRNHGAGSWNLRTVPRERWRSFGNYGPLAISWVAREDITPSRLLPDMLLIAMADTPPSTIAEVRACHAADNRPTAQPGLADCAREGSRALPASELPAARPKSTDSA